MKLALKAVGLAVILGAVVAGPASAQQSDGRLTGGGSTEMPSLDINAEDRYNDGVRALQAQDYNSAQTAFRDVLTADSSNAAANFMMGITRLGLGDVEGSRVYLVAATTNDKKLPDPKGRLGWVEAKLGNLEGAQKQRADLVKLQKRCKDKCAEAGAINASIALIDQALAAPAQ